MTKVRPTIPFVFGPPLPVGHPWSVTLRSRRGWGTWAPRRSHLMVDGRMCTHCHRAPHVCSLSPLRVTTNAQRVTCARCIRNAASPQLLQLGKDVHNALSFWRMFGAGGLIETQLPWVISHFFTAAPLGKEPPWRHRAF